MYGRLDLTELLFSSAGRLSRAPFLILAGALLLTALVYDAVASPAVLWVTGWIVYPFLLFCAASITAKRLHDRGRSGWWAALVLIALVAVWTSSQSYVDVLFSLVILWALIELGCMPGEQGANRFGPPPLRATAAA